MLRRTFYTNLLPDMPELPIECPYEGDCSHHPHPESMLEEGYRTHLHCFIADSSGPDRTFRILVQQRDDMCSVTLHDDDDTYHHYLFEDPRSGYYEFICSWVNNLIVASKNALDNRLLNCGWGRY